MKPVLQETMMSQEIAKNTPELRKGKAQTTADRDVWEFYIMAARERASRHRSWCTLAYLKSQVGKSQQHRASLPSTSEGAWLDFFAGAPCR